MRPPQWNDDLPILASSLPRYADVYSAEFLTAGPVSRDHEFASGCVSADWAFDNRRLRLLERVHLIFFYETHLEKSLHLDLPQDAENLAEYLRLCDVNGFEPNPKIWKVVH